MDINMGEILDENRSCAVWNEKCLASSKALTLWLLLFLISDSIIAFGYKIYIYGPGIQLQMVYCAANVDLGETEINLQRFPGWNRVWFKTLSFQAVSLKFVHEDAVRPAWNVLPSEWVVFHHQLETFAQRF